MDTEKLVSSTACAAFGADPDGRIETWNHAAEELLGHAAADVLGRPCHEVVCGQDVFGNRFCDGACTVHNMARRGESVHPFQMDVPDASGRRIRAGFCTLVLRGSGTGNSSYRIVHLFHRVGANGVDTHDDPSPVGESVTPDAGREPVPNGHDAPFLTPREMEVLTLLNQGEPTRAISASLRISVTTVRNHIQGILRKLGAHSRLEAVSIARRHRLI